MSPSLSALVAFELQLLRLSRSLASAAPTRLSCLPEVQTVAVSRTKPCTVTAVWMTQPDRQRIYQARYRAKLVQQGRALYARRKRVA